MGTHRYSAVDASGRAVSGSLEAADEADALQRLAAGRYTEVRFHPPAGSPAARAPVRPAWAGVTVSASALAQFHRKMASMVRSGVPIMQALRTMGDTTRDRTLRAAIADMEDAAERGRPISEAMDRHPRAFRSGHSGMVRFGEGAGRLAEAFDALATQAEADWKVERATRMNPVLFCTRWFLIPFVAIAAMGGLSVLSALLTGESPSWRAMAGPAVSILALAALAFTAYPAIVKILHRMPWWPQAEDAMFELPLLGARRARTDRVRTISALAAAAEAGAPLSVAWRLAAGTPDSDRLRRRMDAQTSRVLRGEPIANCLMATAAFPPGIVDAARTGELAGNLPEALRHATRYDREEAELIANLTPWVLGTIAYFLYLVLGAILVVSLRGAG